MSQSLRRSEKWFRRGLWIVSFIFASFLIGLGSTVIRDLPSVEQYLPLEAFIDQAAIEPLRETEKATQQTERNATYELEQAKLRHAQMQKISDNAKESFHNWIATRAVTQLPTQDAELISRTKALDNLKQQEGQAWQRVEAQNQILLDACQSTQRVQREIEELKKEASVKRDKAQNQLDLRIFGYRLMLTLPLLLIAGWLFVKKRKTNGWPFVWGFIFFALFTFFIELVPYLPSYGGYVRYIVGILLTIIIGRYAIQALNRYLAHQRQAEQQPDNERRQELSYDIALTRLAKGVCPGCERPVDLTNTAIDFCPHCGMSLFDHCSGCNARKSAFAKFCHACGLAAQPPNQTKSTPPAN